MTLSRMWETDFVGRIIDFLETKVKSHPTLTKKLSTENWYKRPGKLVNERQMNDVEKRLIWHLINLLFFFFGEKKGKHIRQT